MNDPRRQLLQLEKTVQRLREERQNKREIFEAIHDGIIVLKPDLTIKTINSQAKRLLNIDESFLPDNTQLPLFKNKKATLSFKLDTWLNCLHEACNSEPIEIDVWYSDPKTLQSTPLLLCAKALLNKKGKIKHLLLVIYDRTIHSLADEQKRLMRAAFNSFNGQFIANEKGYIVEANDSFVAMSGLTRPHLQNMTLMNWLDAQVNLQNNTNSLLKTLLENKFWSGEVEIYPTPDTTFYAVLSISMIADSDYNIEHYVVSVQNITDIKEAHRQIEHLAFYDGLTGLANRKLAIEQLNAYISNHRRYKSYSGLLYVNLDRFKSLNDAFGRKTGDRFLKRVAAVLKGILREEDNIARVGGDEFIITTQDREMDPEHALRNSMSLAHKISNALDHHFIVDNLTLHTPARVGVIVYPGSEDDTAENLLVKADLAVTEAKNIKKNHKICVYEPALSEEVRHKRHLENDLAHASEKNELELYFQAQIDSDKQLYGAETLIRWKHTEYGYISPAQFIPIAEESRQIVKLGAWIMENAFLQAKKWSKRNPDFNLSVNISPIQFHDADFIEHVLQTMKDTKVNPKNITLELTEGVFISDTEVALHKIQELTEIGFKISIDDFGTGYSSLSYFQKLPIHELKIDKSFIDKIPESEDDIAIIESIVHLANTKNLIIVAEGVEKQEQVDFLHKKYQNILIQGYFYSMPCCAKEFEEQFCSIPS